MKHDGARLGFVFLLVLASVALPAPSDAIEMVKIISLETGDPPFVPLFNPKEITVDKAVPWQKHKQSQGDHPTLEFTSAEPKTLTLELVFDTFEGRQNVYTTDVQRLEKLATVDPTLKRPPMVHFVWGTFPSFTGVIESLSVKYTLFLEDGTPVRATCALRLKQATTVRGKKSPEFTATKCTQNNGCPPGQTCQGGVCAQQ
jgi:hypothetical protein